MICDGVQMKTEHMAHQIVLMPNLLSLYSEDGGVRQTSHLLFEASGSTAEQVEWARRFIASPTPASETTAGGDAQAGAVAYAAAATAAATEHGHGAPR